MTTGKSAPRVVGFDATFCAPKSVSLLFALGAPEVSNEVRNAHDVAVRGAFDVLESLARGRRDRNGTRLVAGDGLIGAAYRHRTSRAAEPHLHTHVVVPNLVFAPEDERWSALDARPLYAWCKPVGHLYRAQLRYELTTRLGVQWEPPVKGLAEMSGFNPKVLRAFSTRRREIEQELKEPKAPQEKYTYAKQEVMQFEPVTRGRFEKSEPTIVEGQDLDVPTFLRKNIRVK